MSNFDVIVIGGGLAGLTAGMFSARYGRATLVVESTVPGGQLINVDKIDDYPGFPEGVAGYALCPMAQEQAMNQGAEFEMAEVQSLALDAPYWNLITTQGSHQAKAVIVAAGSHPKPLGIPGETELVGKGVCHCATCDGPLYKGQAVGVIGGGDSALQGAITLSQYASQVTIFHHGAALAAQQALQKTARENSKIRVRLTTAVEAVIGEKVVTGLKIRATSTGMEETVEVAGVFVYIGSVPNTGFLRGVLALDQTGRIPTDVWMRTELPGLFAAGDARRDSAAQAVTSAGDGATAAVAAHRYIAGRAWE